MAIRYSAPLDRTFHALGDGSRRAILVALSGGEKSAGELCALFEVAQPTVSRHLKVMEKAGLVSRDVVGRQHFFSLETDALRDAAGWITRHVAMWQHALDELETYLDEEAP